VTCLQLVITFVSGKVICKAHAEFGKPMQIDSNQRNQTKQWWFLHLPVSCKMHSSFSHEVAGVNERYASFIDNAKCIGKDIKQNDGGEDEEILLLLLGSRCGATCFRARGSAQTQFLPYMSGGFMEFQKYPEKPILLIDDEADVLHSYKATLQFNKMNNVVLCSESHKAMDLVSTSEFSAVVLDLTMPQVTGQEILAKVHQMNPGLPVIVATGSNRIEVAVECMRAGAFDYLTKPIEEARLIASIRHALDISELNSENIVLSRGVMKRTLDHPEVFASILTNNAAMKAIFVYVEAIAASPRPVLITGESGTGKEAFARAVHVLSGRKGKFVSVNVAGLDDTMFSDTLFGHRKGAFTGADLDRPGLVEQASGGTLFLDEIGSLEMHSQVKLLRLLQEKEYYQLGSDVLKYANVAVVAATNEDLRARMDKGEFRNDLYFRLKTHHIRIPPLRERLDDLPMLITYFAEEAAKTLGKPLPETPASLARNLYGYSFPGNIRELQSMIFDAVGRGSLDHLGVGLHTEQASLSAEAIAKIEEAGAPLNRPFWYTGSIPKLSDVEDFLIREAIEKSGGNQSMAAQMLGVSQSTLSRRTRKETPFSAS
jgi:DNA-binding NtrC family response regulator